MLTRETRETFLSTARCCWTHLTIVIIKRRDSGPVAHDFAGEKCQTMRLQMCDLLMNKHSERHSRTHKRHEKGTMCVRMSLPLQLTSRFYLSVWSTTKERGRVRVALGNGSEQQQSTIFNCWEEKTCLGRFFLSLSPLSSPGRSITRSQH